MAAYYYFNGQLGMTASGSFTRDKSRWIAFTAVEVSRLEGQRPYGATKQGVFVQVA